MSDSPPPEPSPPGRLRRWAPLAIGLLIALAVLAQPLWALDRGGSTSDWRWFHFHWAVSRHTILEHGQLPVWNPYHCGGNVHLANPQTQYLSPLAWPALGLGVTLGIKLFLLLHLVLGYLATWWLGRDLGLRPWPAAAAAALFAGGGYFFQHLGGGHSSFAPFLLMPAALAAYRRSLDDPRYVALAGGVLGLMVIEGGVYPTPYTGLLLAAYGIGLFLHRPSDLRPLVRLAMVAAVAFLVAGVKLLPVMAFLREHPRIVPSDDGMGVVELLQAFVSRRLERRFAGHHYVWPEYGAYLGWPVVVACVLLLWKRARRYAGLFLLLAFFLLMMSGNRGGGFSPHELIHELPLYKSLHVPSRFGAVVSLFLALLAAFALQEWVDALDRWSLKTGWRKGLRIATVILVLSSVVDVLAFGQWQMGRFKDAPRKNPPAKAFRIGRVPWGQGPSLPERRIGTLACYEPNGVPKGKVRADLSEEVFLRKGAEGPVKVSEWSPARVVAEGTLTRPGLLVLNQNDHRGWRVEGAKRTSYKGLPAAQVESPGPVRVAFVYSPPGLVPGTLLTLLGLVALLAIALRATPERWARLRGALAGSVRRLVLQEPTPEG